MNTVTGIAAFGPYPGSDSSMVDEYHPMLTFVLYLFLSSDSSMVDEYIEKEDIDKYII